MTRKVVNIKALLQQAQVALAAVPQPQFEAQLILCAVLACERAYLFAQADKVLTLPQVTAFQQLIQRRQHGEPVAYVLGRQGFWTLDLQVTADTLIPRPETELLVETALTLIPSQTQSTLLDMGTGCGAIALALAAERPTCQVTAVDKSTQALTVAEYNRKQLKLDNVTFLCSDWFDALAQQRFDVIVSNPPYIRQTDPHLHQGDLRFEPQHALISGTDGLDALRLIIHEAPRHLMPAGWLCVEHGYDQGKLVQELFQLARFKQINTRQDLNKLDRMTSGQI